MWTDVTCGGVVRRVRDYLDKGPVLGKESGRLQDKERRMHGKHHLPLLAPSPSSHAHCLCFAEQSKAGVIGGGGSPWAQGPGDAWVSSLDLVTILRPAHFNQLCWLPLGIGTSCHERSGLIRGPLSPSRGPQWPPLSTVEALDEEPSKLCGSPRQDEKTRTLPFWTWLWFNSHADAVHPLCVAWAWLPRVSKMFVKFYSLLSEELESPKLSFIELCLHTGCYIRPCNYIISNPPRDVTRPVIVSLLQTIN